mmetsp:Transcript_188/g.643  ORF Transcript_188/g.643 Transcript_188/m.643 type:complete len:176 (+) Transcript_188:95-622(+)
MCASRCQLLLPIVAMALSLLGHAEASDQVTLTYETVVETYQGGSLVETFEVRGQQEVPAELLFEMLDNEGDALLTGDSEFHLYITFTRYSNSFLTICVVLSVLILLAFVFTERSADEDDEEAEDIEARLAPEGFACLSCHAGVGQRSPHGPATDNFCGAVVLASDDLQAPLVKTS